MKTATSAFTFGLILVLHFLFSACQSSKPALLHQSSPGNSGGTTSTTSAQNHAATTQQINLSGKTVADPAPKLVYDSTKVSFKVKQKTKTEVQISQTEDGEERPTITDQRTELKYKKREKEKGKWLSGGFLISGMAFLAAALALVIIGSGPAGLLAIIGGSLFLVGFILTMLALLGR